MEHEEDRNRPVVTPHQRQTTKKAYALSARQKALTSRRTLNVPLQEDQLYKGEDLKRGYR